MECRLVMPEEVISGRSDQDRQVGVEQCNLVRQIVKQIDYLRVQTLMLIDSKSIGLSDCRSYFSAV